MESLEGLCMECWLDGRKLTSLPHHVDLPVCTNCGEFSFNDRWVKRDMAVAVQDAAVDALCAIKDVTIESIGTDVDCQDPYVYVVQVHTTCNVLGYPAEDESSTIVRIKNNVCRRCSRMLGSYYEAILQIRTGSKDLSPQLREETLAMGENSVARQAANNRQLFITKMELVTGGVDVYLSSMSLGKSLAKELGDAYAAETKESPKLVGQTTDGQDMYRLTYLVRLPDYHVGDVIITNKRYCKLLRVSGNGGRALDLMNFRESAIHKQDMTSIKVYERSDELREATVISNSGTEIQIMHPDNYSTIDLRIPEGYEVGDTVKVVNIDDVLYMVP